MVVYAPPLAEAVGGPVAEIDAAAASAGKPITAVLLATADGPITPGSTVPNFMFPEPAAAVLGRSWAYGHWLATEAASPPAAVDGSTSSAPTSCSPARSLDGPAGSIRRRPPTCCAAYGIPVPPTRFVAAADAVAAADRDRLSRGRQGAPPPRRTIRPRRRRARSRRRRRRAGVDDRRDARRARRRRRLRHRPGDGTAGTRPAHPARTIDDEAGAVDLGRHRRHPGRTRRRRRTASVWRHCRVHSATSLVTESRAGPALTQAGIDPAALVDTLTRAAQLAADHAEITSLDLNPVITSAPAAATSPTPSSTVAPVGRPAGALRRL